MEMTAVVDLSPFEGSKVLITGGLGFIGSNLAHRLAGHCEELILVDSLIPEYGGNLSNITGIEDKIRVNIADVRDESSMDYLVRGKDYLFNLAGQVAHLDSMLDPYTDLEINCRSQLSILEACKKNNRDVKIVYAGTRGQYGKVEQLPVDEKHLMRPTDVNGINKMAGEWYHILYNNVYDIRATSLRLSNTYGPRHHMRTSRQGVLSWFIRLAIEGKDIELFGGGEQQRDFSYVDDVVDALLLAAANDDANGEVFNIGSGAPVSLKEAAELVVDVAQAGAVHAVPFPPDKKKIEIGNYYADISKAGQVLGWEPKVSLREGLERTIEFFRLHQQHYWDID
jgi:UDP-glucose 4-epimerase